MTDSKVKTKSMMESEKDSVPEKNTRPYTVYRNDIKYRNRNDIDMSRAVFENEEVKNDFLNGNTDTIDYRIKDCIREKYQIFDLAHMTKDVFELCISHKDFNTIAQKIEVLSANDCGIEKLEDLSMFSKLISLNIGDNKLTKLPKLPESLEELIIDNNNIQLIPYMKNLKRLRARNNDIRRIHYSNSMESLNLSGNSNLTELAPLSELYHLEIGKTGITEVPIFPNLKYLDIDETRIKSLPQLPYLHILTCVRSELSDISNLSKLYSLIATNSKVRRVHYMDTLQKFTYNSLHQNEIRLSNRYKAHRIVKNKSDIVDVMFKENPAPVNCMK